MNQKIKGIEFDVSATEFTYKTPDESFIFNSDKPAKSLTKSLTELKVHTLDAKIIGVNLDDFSLHFDDLQKIGDAVNSLNIIFENANEKKS